MPSVADFGRHTHHISQKPPKEPKNLAINPYPGRGNDKVPFHSTHPSSGYFSSKKVGGVVVVCVCGK